MNEFTIVSDPSDPAEAPGLVNRAADMLKDIVIVQRDEFNPWRTCHAVAGADAMLGRAEAAIARSGLNRDDQNTLEDVLMRTRSVLAALLNGTGDHDEVVGLAWAAFGLLEPAVRLPGMAYADRQAA